MLAVQTDWLDVPTIAGTVLQDREGNDYLRLFIFENMTDSSISVTIQQSSDGGGTWADLSGMPFTLGAVGSGTEVQIKTVGATDNILRVRMSGGNSDRDVVVTLCRYYLDVSKVWSRPML